MSDTPLADIPKDGRERLRIDLSEFKGVRFADLRIYATASDGGMVPTKAGVAIRPHMIRATIAGLREAEQRFVEAGLLDEEDRT